MDLDFSDFRKVPVFLRQWRPQIDLLYTIILYTPFLLPAATRHFKSSKTAKMMGYPYKALLVHLIAGSIELLRYHVMALSAEPSADGIDVTLCILQAVTSMLLCKGINRGNKFVIRTSFQALALQRMLATGISYATTSPTWHRASIKILNQFIYNRYLLGELVKLDIFPGGRPSAFSALVFASGSVALWEGDYPWGVPMFSALVLGLVAFERWVGRVVFKRQVKMLR